MMGTVGGLGELESLDWAALESKRERSNEGGEREEYCAVTRASLRLAFRSHCSLEARQAGVLCCYAPCWVAL